MSEREDQPPRFPEWLRRPQTLVALSALLLSVCGVFISIYEASLTRRAQRASVWPYVEVGSMLNPDEIRIWVQNTGIGPARIHTAAITYRGELVRSWSELIDRVVGEEADTRGVYQSLVSGRVLPVESEDVETLFAAANEDGSDEKAWITRLRDTIIEGAVDVSVCFCSVYEECWTSNMQAMIERWRGVEATSGSQEVESCDSAPRSSI